jgi:hypothetical protein
MFNRVFIFGGYVENGELHGRMAGFADSAELVFRRFDDTDESRREGRDKTGFYSDLQYIEEAGDNVGEELLVGNIAGRLTVALMTAEGAVSAPRLGFNIAESRDTLRFDFARDTSAPRVTAVFGDSAVSISLSDEEGDPQRLPKVFSLPAFYDQPAEGACVPLKPPPHE